MRMALCKDLETKVHIEMNVAISLGLEIFASIIGFTSIALEVFMKNSIAISTKVVACVWCGIAFLRSSGEKKFQPIREICIHEYM